MRILPILLVCPFMTGCLAFGYPSLTQTPAITVKEQDVKAFRVSSEIDSYGPLMTGPIEIQEAIKEIPIHDRTVAGQCDFHFAYYYLAIPFGGSYRRSFDIRLYRRGYETIVIEPSSWMPAIGENRLDNIEWKKAETLEAREKAIDDVITHLVNFREASAFLADEYQSLANSQQINDRDGAKARTRLEEKANKMRASERNLPH